MDEPLNAFLAAQRVFTDVVHAVGEDDWHAPTPDTEWDVATLLGHLVEEHRYAAPLLHGQDLDSARMVVEGSRKLPVDGGVGANLAEEWDEAAVESSDAFSADGALDREVALSRGSTPARQYIAEMTFDLVVHGWDLARAIGRDVEFPPEVVEHVLEQAKEFGDLSGSGMFDKPVDVPDDAPALDRLIGLTGRDPAWKR
jgi:uncharacterized protein (TIGR03086 family)